uniref:Rad60/SUMO-like domain-containing protein n=1 Tax=Oryza punctata TaxID=4537 RepID=A0A0E0LMI8_ORYPU
MVRTANYEHAKQVKGEKTPADYEMEDGDQISLSPVTKATDDDDEYSFFSASKRSMFVTVTVRLQACVEKNIEHTHTLRRTDELQGLMDLCSSIVLPSKCKRRWLYNKCLFFFDGDPVHGTQTPDDLKI